MVRFLLGRPLVRFVQTAPEAVGTIDPIVQPVGTDFTFNASDYFVAPGLAVYTLDTDSDFITIDPETNVVTISAAAERAQATATLICSNGTLPNAEQTFTARVQFQNAEAWEFGVQWLVRKNPDAVPDTPTAGTMQLLLDDEVPNISPDAEYRVYATNVIDGPDSWSVSMTPGQDRRTVSTKFNDGVEIFCKLFRYSNITGEFTLLDTGGFVMADGVALDPVADVDWTFEPADPPVAGDMEVLVDSEVDVPSGHTLRLYVGATLPGEGVPLTTVAITPGTPVVVETGLTTGIVYAALYYREAITDLEGLASVVKLWDLTEGEESQPPPVFDLADWSLAEAPGTPYGRSVVSREATPLNPAGYVLRVPAGAVPTLDATGRQLDPGESFTTTGVFEGPTGKVRWTPVWHRLADDTFTVAGAYKEFDITVPEAPTPGAIVFANPPQSVVNALNSYPVMRFGDAQSSSDMSPEPYNAGPYMVYAALLSYNGRLSQANLNICDSITLRNLREAIKGQYSMLAADGAGRFGENMYLATACLAKITPRVWNQLSSGEKSKIDTVVKSRAFGAAFKFGEQNRSQGFRGMRGSGSGYYPSQPGNNQSHKMAQEWSWIFATLYFGGVGGGHAAWRALREAYDHDTFKAELQSQGLTNTYNVYNTSYANGLKSHINAVLRNTSWRAATELGSGGWTVTEWKEEAAVRVQDAASRERWHGINNNAGVSGTSCGRTLNTSGYPGSIGITGMFNGLRTGDGFGSRVSCSYSRFDYDYCMMMLMVMAAYGEWDDATMPSTALTYISRACDDLQFKMTVGGFRDFHSGQCRGTWPKTGSDISKYGMVHRFSMWEDIMKPYLT